ncbi:ATP-dependent helicase [Haloechinothrix halophila]|uniref:ATP-dependent helicase n=1 Tax=Haloechinothrix halophila TaxID=1069073 RepID=UPI00040351EB|nr:ATP-dependent helicase [Haloechinothrix halophila]
MAGDEPASETPSSTGPADVLRLFSAPTREWFTLAFAAPTPVQDGTWRAAHSGEHALVVSPTGSGKTLAAFLHAIDRLATTPVPADPLRRCRVLYVSPLKALAVDVQRNLRAPLAGIADAAGHAGLAPPDITIGMRTGDTSASERRTLARTPPDILVTTPESLYLLLTSHAREALRGVDTVIVDEVHAVAGTKRGAHLALSLERLDALLDAPAQRIGLSATVRPADEIATFLTGGHPVRVVRPETHKTIAVTVEVPVADMTAPPATPNPAGPDAEPRQPSIWPSVERRVYELITAHRSTIVFTNSRRLAERITARLNELHAEEQRPLRRHPAQAVGQSGITTGVPPTVIAKAHHGSMAREQRGVAEAELKAGTLPCVVATSSLELGIDMGAVDLVVQIEPPPSVAAGMQRVGRASHTIDATSTGVLFPKLRGELAASAVVAERMAGGAIEALHYPRNPLDVLAQQIVAMVAMDDYAVADLAALVRRAAPFAQLGDESFDAVLDMLAGRYPSTDFAELRPRVVWDRAAGTVTARPGAQRLAVTSGGTIPDRGLYPVMTASGNATGSRASRVGELDEEMVHESRVGDTILLGTSSWRITEITHDRVVVAPAPGEAARMPFWKGDTPARPFELGSAIGGFLREISSAENTAARQRLGDAGLDGWASDNLLDYLAEQRTTTGHVPDDRTIVVERFRDELGDWRIVVHSPFGGAVNAPWALLIGAELRERRGVDTHVASADDGIVLRLPDSVEWEGTPHRAGIPGAADLLFDPDTVEELLTAELGSSALFAARFRECAARSLLLPKRDPRRRTPLWQQRHRSSQLLTVAASYERFPVVHEAMRECLRDLYDVDSLRELLTAIRQRTVRVVEVETPKASPFARNLLFGYVGLNIYDDDLPLAERRATALSIDTELLAELLGTDSLRELLDADVIAEVEAALQHLPEDRHARGVEDTADLLRVLGDLSAAEAARRGVAAEGLAELREAGRAIVVCIAGEDRYLAVEDAGRVRAALGVELPPGIPDAFTEPVPDPLADLLTRYARGRGPFHADTAAARFGLSASAVTEALDRLVTRGTLVRGELDPTATDGVDYCDADVLRRIRRACLARLRKDVEPVEQAALGRFLPAWHEIGTGRKSDDAGRQPHGAADDVYSCVEQLAGAPIPASALESLVLPARLPGYSPALLDELTTAGEVTWCGCGSVASGDGWLALAPADVADLLLPDPEPEPDGELPAAILRVLDGGALFFRQLVDAVSREVRPAPNDTDVVAALWELVWAGWVTGDSLAGLRAVLAGGGTHRPRRQAPRGRTRGRYARMRAGRPTMPTQTGPPTVAGRWALTPAREPDPTRRAHARTEALLERHGVLTRGALDTERISGGFAGIYPVLRGMADTGQVIRGYVVDGLGAAQFAARGAVDRLRSLSDTGGGRHAGAVALAACDPAQPYGAALAWPTPVGGTAHRPGRKAGAVVVLVDGAPVLYLERGGSSLLTFTTGRTALRTAADTLAAQVSAGRIDSLLVRRADGEQALWSDLAEVLGEAGFRHTPQGLRLRAY